MKDAMSGFSWWNVIPSTVGGLIGGSFAVLGMWTTGRRERRRVREAYERESLLAIRHILLKIQDLYTTEVNPEDRWGLTEMGDQQLERLIRELTAQADVISDGVISGFFTLASRSMSNNAVSTFQGDRESQIVRRICWYGHSLLSARLAGQQPPLEPEFVTEYRSAIEEADEIWRQHDADEASARLAKHSSSVQSVIAVEAPPAA